MVQPAWHGMVWAPSRGTAYFCMYRDREENGGMEKMFAPCGAGEAFPLLIKKKKGPPGEFAKGARNRKSTFGAHASTIAPAPPP